MAAESRPSKINGLTAHQAAALREFVSGSEGWRAACAIAHPFQTLTALVARSFLDRDPRWGRSIPIDKVRFRPNDAGREAWGRFVEAAGGIAAADAWIEDGARKRSRPLETLRWTAIEPVDWMEPLLDAARRLDIDAMYDGEGTTTGMIDPARVGAGLEILVATGSIRPHTDPDLPRWSYLFVLACGDCVFTAHGHKPIRPEPGMLIEFDAYRSHGLKQVDRRAPFVWMPYDSPVRLDLTEAELRHRLKAEAAFGASSTFGR